MSPFLYFSGLGTYRLCEQFDLEGYDKSNWCQLLTLRITDETRLEFPIRYS